MKIKVHLWDETPPFVIDVADGVGQEIMDAQTEAGAATNDTSAGRRQIELHGLIEDHYPSTVTNQSSSNLSHVEKIEEVKTSAKKRKS